MDPIKMGKFIAKLRKEKNLTQYELASKLGINSKSISRWENGVQTPDISLLQSLALELGVTVDTLLSGERINIDKLLKCETKINGIIDCNKYKVMKINDLPKKFYQSDNIVIEAYIFGMDIIIYEEKLAVLTLKLSDMTGSIIARVIVSIKSLPKSLEKIRLGTSWRFYGECFNKKFDGMSIIQMQQIPPISKSLIDNEQEKYFFFEALDIETVKYRKRNALEKDKLNL